MKITVLAENTALNNSFGCEHGLSFYIELNNNTKILFDMGQSDLFIKNALKLGIDLSKVDFAIVSHGHYDHGGGLNCFLEINPTANVYIRKEAFGEFYNASGKYIGLDKSLSDCNRLIFCKDELEIAKGIKLCSQNNAVRLHKTETYGLTVRSAQTLTDDTFEHEQYLFLEDDKKRVVISGCSHKGILNIIDWFKPDIVVGGFHFSKLMSNELDKNIEKLKEFKTVFYTCHCTGVEQYRYIKTKMENVKYISAGESFTI